MYAVKFVGCNSLIVKNVREKPIESSLVSKQNGWLTAVRWPFGKGLIFCLNYLTPKAPSQAQALPRNSGKEAQKGTWWGKNQEKGKNRAVKNCICGPYVSHMSSQILSKSPPPQPSALVSQAKLLACPPTTSRKLFAFIYPRGHYWGCNKERITWVYDWILEKSLCNQAEKEVLNLFKNKSSYSEGIYRTICVKP